MSELVQPSATELATAVSAAAEAAVAVAGGALRRVGVDVVDLRRFERQVAVVGERFVSKLLTTAEIDHCSGRIEQLATRVAAKEAAAKVLGTGFRGVRWHESRSLRRRTEARRSACRARRRLPRGRSGWTLSN